MESDARSSSPDPELTPWFSNEPSASTHTARGSARSEQPRTNYGPNLKISPGRNSGPGPFVSVVYIEAENANQGHIHGKSEKPKPNNDGTVERNKLAQDKQEDFFSTMRSNTSRKNKESLLPVEHRADQRNSVKLEQFDQVSDRNSRDPPSEVQSTYRVNSRDSWQRSAIITTPSQDIIRMISRENNAARNSVRASVPEPRQAEIIEHERVSSPSASKLNRYDLHQRSYSYDRNETEPTLNRTIYQTKSLNPKSATKKPEIVVNDDITAENNILYAALKKLYRDREHLRDSRIISDFSQANQMIPSGSSNSDNLDERSIKRRPVRDGKTRSPSREAAENRGMRIERYSAGSASKLTGDNYMEIKSSSSSLHDYDGSSGHSQIAIKNEEKGAMSARTPRSIRRSPEGIDASIPDTLGKREPQSKESSSTEYRFKGREIMVDTSLNDYKRSPTIQQRDPVKLSPLVTRTPETESGQHNFFRQDPNRASLPLWTEESPNGNGMLDNVNYARGTSPGKKTRPRDKETEKYGSSKMIEASYAGKLEHAPQSKSIIRSNLSCDQEEFRVSSLPWDKTEINSTDNVGKFKNSTKEQYKDVALKDVEGHSREFFVHPSNSPHSSRRDKYLRAAAKKSSDEIDTKPSVEYRLYEKPIEILKLRAVDHKIENLNISQSNSPIVQRNISQSNSTSVQTKISQSNSPSVQRKKDFPSQISQSNSPSVRGRIESYSQKSQTNSPSLLRKKDPLSRVSQTNSPSLLRKSGPPLHISQSNSPSLLRRNGSRSTISLNLLPEKEGHRNNDVRHSVIGTTTTILVHEDPKQVLDIETGILIKDQQIEDNISSLSLNTNSTELSPSIISSSPSLFLDDVDLKPAMKKKDNFVKCSRLTLRKYTRALEQDIAVSFEPERRGLARSQIEIGMTATKLCENSERKVTRSLTNTAEYSDISLIKHSLVDPTIEAKETFVPMSTEVWTLGTIESNETGIASTGLSQTSFTDVPAVRIDAGNIHYLLIHYKFSNIF